MGWAVPLLYVVGMAGTAAAGVMGAVAQGRAATASVRMARYESQQAREQAALAAKEIRRKSRFLRGEQMASIAASGVVPLGSPLDILGDTATHEEEIARQAIRRGELEAWNLTARGRISAAQLRAQQGATILGTASSLASSAAMFQLAGGWTGLAKTPNSTPLSPGAAVIYGSKLP